MNIKKTQKLYIYIYMYVDENLYKRKTITQKKRKA